MAGLTNSRIFAIEIDDQAIALLGNMQLSGVTGYCANIYDDNALAEIAHLAQGAEVLVLDPPRDGMEKILSVTQALKKLQRIYCISCDLATFRRDAEQLALSGFGLQEVQPIDMFPHTPHLGIMAYFSR